MTPGVSRFLISIPTVLLLASIAPSAKAGSIEVTVVDSRDRAPIGGAFVMIGPSEGDPFAANTGTTDPSGVIIFQDPALIGPQTVTAGASGHAFFSVIEAAETAVTIPLSPSVADTTIYGQAARVQGGVDNIQMSIDGSIDAAVVLPAMTLDEIIGTGSVQYDAPTDSLTLPLVGQVYVPGNMAIPTQVELFTTISKPIYHIDLRANTVQTLYAVAARIPLSVLISLPPGVDLIKYATIRELGVERDLSIGTGITRSIDSDLNLSTQLTVRFEGAPGGTQVQVASLGSIPGWDGHERIIGYDADFALVDSLDTFVLASWNPVSGSDISDVANLVAGYYADTSVYGGFMAGRVDRTPVTMPATRVLRDFYDPPQLTQDGARLAWSDVATPGVEPTPTWVVHEIRAGPITPGDPAVQESLAWRIAVPASMGSFALPVLPPDAPGPPAGLPDIDATPMADRLIWDAYVANPTGTLGEILERPSTGVTHFSRRTQTLNLSPADVAVAVPAEPRSLLVAPNPAGGGVRLILDRPFDRPGTIEITDLQGRRIRSLSLGAGAREVAWDGRDASGRVVAQGTYFARLPERETGRATKLQRVR